MKLFSTSLLAAAGATTILELVGRFYGFSPAPVLWLFLPHWIVVPNFIGVFVGLFVQAFVGWSGWLSSDLSSLVLCTLGNWLAYFAIAKLAVFLKGKVSQASLANHLDIPHNS